MAKRDCLVFGVKGGSKFERPRHSQHDVVAKLGNDLKCDGSLVVLDNLEGEGDKRLDDATTRFFNVGEPESRGS